MRLFYVETLSRRIDRRALRTTAIDVLVIVFADLVSGSPEIRPVGALGRATLYSPEGLRAGAVDATAFSRATK